MGCRTVFETMRVIGASSMRVIGALLYEYIQCKVNATMSGKPSQLATLGVLLHPWIPHRFTT